MRLTPIDIEQQRFARHLRGYDRREVQQFLELVAAQTAEANREIAESRAEVRRQAAELDELRAREEGLKDAMLTAQKAIDDLRDNAHKEAQLIVSEAEMRAEKILHNAQRKATDIHGEISELRRQRVRFLEEMRGVINTHARLLDVHDEPAMERHLEAPVTLLERLRPPTPPGASLEDASA